jgi:hypothetical protein
MSNALREILNGDWPEKAKQKALDILSDDDGEN